MDEILGIPITAIMTGLLAILALSLLSVAWIAWRHRVVFKLGMRNIPRRKAQTVLVVAGLMLSTMIISASLGTGDTLDHSVSGDVYDLLGAVDEVVVYSQGSEGETATSLTQTIPAGTLGLVQDALAGNSDVDAVGAILLADMPVFNGAAQQAEASVTVAGIDPATVEAFGGLASLGGDPIALDGLGPNGVVLSETAAGNLDAAAGDVLTVYYANQPIDLVVAAIAPDSILSGAIDPTVGGLAMPLAHLQAITGQAGQVSMVAISNTGDVRAGVSRTDSVVAALEPALAGHQLGIDPIKQDQVDSAVNFAQVVTDIFLIFGLFSIAAGILLIVLIFTMLAAERRPEMGMARAVGAKRSQLVQQFVAEGMGYALLAGLVGSALGVLASAGIAYGMKLIIGELLRHRAPHRAAQPRRRLRPRRGHHLHRRRRLVLEDQPPQHRRRRPRHPGRAASRSGGGAPSPGASRWSPAAPCWPSPDTAANPARPSTPGSASSPSASRTSSASPACPARPVLTVAGGSGDGPLAAAGRRRHAPLRLLRRRHGRCSSSAGVFVVAASTLVIVQNLDLAARAS